MANWFDLPRWAKAMKGLSPQEYAAWLVKRALEPKGKPGAPRGLGGYDLVQTGVVRLDERQRTGYVKEWYAELRERNKYFPDGSLRADHA